MFVLAALMGPEYSVSDAVKLSFEPAPTRLIDDLLTPSGPGLTETLADVVPRLASEKLMVAVPPAPGWFTGVTVKLAVGPTPGDVTVATLKSVLLAVMAPL